jgi:hypothetical protein
VPTLPRPPQARLAIRDDARSPLKVKPGWAIHTTNPNFGKVEYFCMMGLTERRHSKIPPGWSGRVIREGAKCRASGPGLRCAPSGLRATRLLQDVKRLAEMPRNICLHSATFGLPKGHDP